jgi:glucan phosphoethanolaminetransferase (alkaline phosphatase superfamily)
MLLRSISFRKLADKRFSFLLRPWIVTVVILQMFDWIISSFRPSVSSFDAIIYFEGILISILAGYWISLCGLLLPTALQYVFFPLFALFLSLMLVINFFVFQQFGEYLTLQMLTFVWQDPKYFSNYIYTYLFNINIFWFFLLTTLFFFIWHPWKQTEKSRTWKRTLILLVIVVIPILTLLNQVRLYGEGKRIPEVASTILAFKNLYKYVSSPNELYASKHESVCTLPKDSQPDFNIIFVFNESWGKQGLSFYGSSDTAMPFMQHWIDQEKDNFFIFPHAFSNSGATDVSVPSMLTGVGPEEGAQKLHKQPFLWDWAKAVGMKTLFVSSFRYGWGHFDRFFFSPGPEEHITAENIPAPTINDSGIDDLISIDVFCDALKRVPKGKTFLGIFNSNALHYPYQQGSDRLKRQPKFTSAYENGQFILDAAFEKMYSSLVDEGILDRTFFIFTADHCDTDSIKHPMPRIYSYYDEIIEIPFIIRIPPAWEQKHLELVQNLRANLKKNICNLDIVPTIASLIEAHHQEQNASILSSLQGKNLLSPLPPERMIVALNTNDIRQWNHEGFGIVREHTRFICSDVEKITYYDVQTDPSENKNIWDWTSMEQKAIVINAINVRPQLKRIFEKVMK